MKCIKINEDDGRYLHLEGISEMMSVTLCGFVDIDGEVKEVDGIPDCPPCLAIIKNVKNRRVPKKYYQV